MDNHPQTDQPEKTKYQLAEASVKLRLLREWSSHPCYEHFVKFILIGNHDNDVKLIIDHTPNSIGEIFLREQTIGEARGLKALHNFVVEELTKLNLDSQPERKADHERRNAVEPDPTV